MAALQTLGAGELVTVAAAARLARCTRETVMRAILEARVVAIVVLEGERRRFFVPRPELDAFIAGRAAKREGVRTPAAL